MSEYFSRYGMPIVANASSIDWLTLSISSIVDIVQRFCLNSIMLPSSAPKL